MSPLRLEDQLKSLGQPRVLVVGDLILDRYVSGEVRRISPEAPIPVLAAESSEHRLGGAGNVAVNLASMEARVHVVGVVGADRPGGMVEQILAQHGIGADLVADESKVTIQKSRMLSGVHQMLRVDWEDPTAIEGEVLQAVRAHVEKRLVETDVVVLSDYGKGTLPPELLAVILAAARAQGVSVLIDPKGADYSRYKGATLLTPNLREAEVAVGNVLDSDEAIVEAGNRLKELVEVDKVVITLGPRGIYFRDADRDGQRGPEGRIPTVARAVYDVTGAGDTVVAVLAMCMAEGWDLEPAVDLANHAAGIVVAKLGAHSVERTELLDSLRQPRGADVPVQVPEAAHPKRLDPSNLEEQVAIWKKADRRVVFTNGCFDVLHAGHVQYLGFARSQGDVLLVGVNSDASIKRLKGEGRPLHSLGDRMSVLAALEMVDGVVAFDEDTPLDLIKQVTPDVLVKGEDWAQKGVVGREWVESHGGQVILAPLLEGRSTSAVIESVLRNASQPVGGDSPPAGASGPAGSGSD
ncbi:MAG TPA: D-glycero-beta-D-manno-heptose-7-phosphate kinase [Planctomycetes bacterium]|nr:D-glycero-beta-D-manno-heptose-7-phosphate kinase [Planctomycetota bacterium]